MDSNRHRDLENGPSKPESLSTEEIISEATMASHPHPQTHTHTQRGLKSRHAQMIALGGTIGTGLFVGTGQALAIGGPLFLLLAYLLIAFLIFGISSATGEMSSYLPVPGSSVPFFANRIISDSLGFALGWVHWYTMGITIAVQIVACVLLIEYWQLPIDPSISTTVFLVVIIALNCFPVNIYGETEFWFASLKVFTILGLIILSVVLFFGGGPKHDALYFRYWSDPGSMNEFVFSGSMGKFCAFLATLPYAFYAFAFAPEVLVVTAGEMQNPRLNLPMATKKLIWRLVLFYVIGVFCVGIIMRSDHPRLRGGKGSGSSPWVLGIQAAGIRGLDSVVNAMFLISAWSAGNSYFYLTSRMLYSMALSGTAPKIFARTTTSGIPYWATLVSILWGFLSYVHVSKGGTAAFDILVNLNNTGGYESWICVCIMYICFRKATDRQGITDIPYRSRLQPYYSWISGISFLLLLILSGFHVFLKGQWDLSVFLSAYIGIPVFAALYFGHRFTVGRRDPWKRPPESVDLHTGLQEVKDEETPETSTQKWYMAWTHVFW
ncbi:hypothetical protein NM208_g5923 [Fusarium decemcellulare]|uniref:Uncharacterized protein n=1 Tax=Fusarium decemcellulare TaxID=57161 RepID=A0ACC1SF11_9HYPO|nr:hypothetical protein NM208_g5923 [Fusarium decemcellulare]